jgi:RNA polymerase sigma-70 factor (ECF subfamily)
MNIRQQKATIEESQIVKLLQDRDKQAIALLYDRYAGALYGIISNLIADEATAQETLQDVFVRIWNNSDKYDAGKGRLFTWMVQLTRHIAIDTLRSSQFKKNSKTESLPNSVSNNAAHSEELRIGDPALRRVVNQLDETNRRVIELLYFEDYTQKEVCEALGIPLGTVKSKARKAISQLRELLGDEKLLLLAGIIFIYIIIQP